MLSAVWKKTLSRKSKKPTNANESFLSFESRIYAASTAALRWRLPSKDGTQNIIEIFIIKIYVT